MKRYRKYAIARWVGSGGGADSAELVTLAWPWHRRAEALAHADKVASRPGGTSGVEIVEALVLRRVRRRKR